MPKRVKKISTSRGKISAMDRENLGHRAHEGNRGKFWVWGASFTPGELAEFKKEKTPANNPPPFAKKNPRPTSPFQNS